MIHAKMGADVPGRSGKAHVAGKDRVHDGVVEVHDGPERVERAFGQRAFAAKARGGRGLAGKAGNQLHEQLGQFLIMDRSIDGQGREAVCRVGRAVAASGEHGVDRKVNGPGGGNLAFQASSNLGEI